MDKDYRELLKTAYEIEGLLALQVQRADNHNAAIDSLIAEKVAMMSRAFAEPVVVTGAPVVTPEEEVEMTQEISILDETGTEEIKDDAEIAESVETEEREDADSREDTDETLFDKLARERASDLTSAFTLNDKFRFRRELFRNSPDEMNEAIQALSQMSTLEEAEEYIYDDLCLDPDNEDVKAFMEIIGKHF